MCLVWVQGTRYYLSKKDSRPQYDNCGLEELSDMDFRCLYL